MRCACRWYPRRYPLRDRRWIACVLCGAEMRECVQAPTSFKSTGISLAVQVSAALSLPRGACDA
eukprot:3897041-Rhodomonas_salina.1